MATPLFKGRKLPKNDWEGDDFTPGAGTHYVTCVDTSSGRMVAYATNGRINHDGKIYRKAIVPPDPNGITLQQAAQAVHTVTHLSMVMPALWGWADVVHHLTAGHGLIVIGRYDSLPREYRFQTKADFEHAMFVSHFRNPYSARVWDPLNPDITRWGKWMPTKTLKVFLESHAGPRYSVAYVPLQHLTAA